MIQNKVPLEILHLTKKYGKMLAVDDVSFSIHPGEVFGLLGPNGAGKTTIISMIATLEKPTSGNIEVFGNNMREDPRKGKYLMGIVPQELINHGYFTVFEIMQIHSSYYGIHKNEKRIQYLLETLDLWKHKDKSVHYLSGGMKRRLLIGKALLHNPKLLLLDEPTAGVDIELRAQMWEFIRDLKKKNRSILLTTHYLEEAEKLCDRIGILHHGKLRMLEDTKVILEKMTSREILIILNEPFSPPESPYLIEKNTTSLLFQVPRNFTLGSLLNEIQIPTALIQDIEIRDGKLEDAFRIVLGDTYEPS